jgi:hypothetical protein
MRAILASMSGELIEAKRDLSALVPAQRSHVNVLPVSHSRGNKIGSFRNFASRHRIQ